MAVSILLKKYFWILCYSLIMQLLTQFIFGNTTRICGMCEYSVAPSYSYLNGQPLTANSLFNSITIPLSMPAMQLQQTIRQRRPAPVVYSSTAISSDSPQNGHGMILVWFVRFFTLINGILLQL